MPRRHRTRLRNSPDRQQLLAARRLVHRWMAWFFPPVMLLALLVLLRVDRDIIAVCLLAFPVVIIRAVEAWSDYQTARAAVHT